MYIEINSYCTYCLPNHSGAGVGKRIGSGAAFGLEYQVGGRSFFLGGGILGVILYSRKVNTALCTVPQLQIY